MKPRHLDFWDSLESVIHELHNESSKMLAIGKLGEFEMGWHDPITKLWDRSWFADANAVARKIGEESIRVEVKSIIKNYRLDEKLLDADFG